MRKTISNEIWRGHALRIILGITAIALLLQSVNLAAANSPSKIKNVSSETGVTVTQKVPFIKESIADIKLHESKQPAHIPEQRVIPFHKGPPFKELHGIAPLNPQNAPQFGNVTSSLAPDPNNSFIGLNTIGKGTILHQPPSFYQPISPPDTTGAAGPSYLMEMTNDEVGFFNNSNGTLISSTTLQAFWSSLGTHTGEPANDLTDPQVIYDQYSGSFIAVTLGGISSPPSWLMLGISNTSDPTGTWYKWAIDANKNVGIQTDNLADYPGLGVDADNVYVTANMYDNSSGNQRNYSYSKVWVFNKTQLLDGPSIINFTPISDPQGSGFTMQPAHVFGSSSAEYFIYEGGYSLDTPPRLFFNISSITFPGGPGGVPKWTSLGLVEVSSYPITGSYPITDLLPYAPQLGSSNLAKTGDSRLLNAVFSNGYLWTTHTVSDDNNTKTEVAWYQIDPANASDVSPGTPVQEGRINDSNLWYYYPSIAVNSSNYVVIGFSGSSSGEYIGAYYTARNASDAPGTMQSVRRLKKGEFPYNGVVNGITRWGDYSATVVDPTDDSTFWTVQAYAYNSDPPLWGTWWGKISPGLSISASQDTVTVGTPTNVTP